MLEATDLALTYTTGDTRTKAVDGVNLTLNRGEFVGLVGPSGSGKSSLLYLLAGLRQPSGGRVVFEGQELSALPDNARAALRQRLFGFIFQQHFLIEYLTAVENVLVALPKPSGADRRRATELLSALGLAAQLRKHPAQLSGGERQRVAAARAIMHGPAIIFADEPTASLDHATAFDLMRVIRALRASQRTALVVVTHDPSILGGADRVLRMWDGRITGESAPPPATEQGATSMTTVRGRRAVLSPAMLRAQRRQHGRPANDAAPALEPDAEPSPTRNG